LYIRQDFLNSRAWFSRSWIWLFHGYLIQFNSDSSNTWLFGSKIMGLGTRLCIFCIHIKSPHYTMLLWLYRLFLQLLLAFVNNVRQPTQSRNTNVVITILSSLMTYRHVCNKSNTMGTTSGAGDTYASGAHEFNPFF